MDERFRISAKKLGAVAMSDFCPRCFWIRTHLNGEPPFSIFPQIFGHIDGYMKRVVHGWIDDKGEPPKWLKDLGDISGYIYPPKSSKFQMPLGEDVLLTGEADAIFKLKGGGLLIADYKTAFCRGLDDPLYVMYLIQLNSYALLAEHLGLGKVKKLSLIYAEPATGDISAKQDTNRRDDGFALGFGVKLFPVELCPALVSAAAKKAYSVYTKATAPLGRDGCENCERMETMSKVATKTTYDYRQIGY